MLERRDYGATIGVCALCSVAVMLKALSTFSSPSVFVYLFCLSGFWVGFAGVVFGGCGGCVGVCVLIMGVFA